MDTSVIYQAVVQTEADFLQKKESFQETLFFSNLPEDEDVVKFIKNLYGTALYLKTTSEELRATVSKSVQSKDCITRFENIYVTAPYDVFRFTAEKEQYVLYFKQQLLYRDLKNV